MHSVVKKIDNFTDYPIQQIALKVGGPLIQNKLPYATNSSSEG